MKDIRTEVSPRVYNIILDFMKSLNIKSFGIKSRYTNGNQILTIYTNRPGLIIGKSGTTIHQLLDKIHEDILDRDINIDLEEVEIDQTGLVIIMSGFLKRIIVLLNLKIKLKTEQLLSYRVRLEILFTKFSNTINRRLFNRQKLRKL